MAIPRSKAFPCSQVWEAARIAVTRVSLSPTKSTLSSHVLCGWPLGLVMTGHNPKLISTVFLRLSGGKEGVHTSLLQELSLQLPHLAWAP